MWFFTCCYNLMVYLRPVWIYLQPVQFQKISRNRHWPVCKLFMPGVIPKTCTVTLPLKSNRTSQYHRLISVLQILHPTTEFSLKIAFLHHFQKWKQGIFWCSCLCHNFPGHCQHKGCNQDRLHYSNYPLIDPDNSWALNYFRAWAISLTLHRLREKKNRYPGPARDAFWCVDNRKLSIFILQFCGWKWTLVVCRRYQTGFSPRYRRLLYVCGLPALTNKYMSAGGLILISVIYLRSIQHHVLLLNLCHISWELFSCLLYFSLLSPPFFTELKAVIKSVSN